MQILFIIYIIDKSIAICSDNKISNTFAVGDILNLQKYGIAVIVSILKKSKMLKRNFDIYKVRCLYGTFELKYEDLVLSESENKEDYVDIYNTNILVPGSFGTGR